MKNKNWPDFGKHVVEFESGGYKTTLECNYIVPGLTLMDLMKKFQEAHDNPDNSEYSSNLTKTPDGAGVLAVIKAILDALYP